MGVPRIRSLLFGVYIRAPDFGKRLFEPLKGSFTESYKVPLKGFEVAFGLI